MEPGTAKYRGHKTQKKMKIISRADLPVFFFYQTKLQSMPNLSTFGNVAKYLWLVREKNNANFFRQDYGIIMKHSTTIHSRSRCR